jgi:two-component system, chemotaxis family, response regulator Rcp1
MNSAEKIQSANILLVEDNPDAVLMVREALGGNELIRELHVAPDGVEAIGFLRREGRYNTAPRPQLILLDLCLPRKNGFQVLAEIKQDESLKDIPVIVMSTSHSEEDIMACYRLHANCYISKPLDFDEFCRNIISMVHFWLITAALPAYREG